MSDLEADRGQGWAKVSIAQAHAQLTVAGSPFEIGEEVIDGHLRKVWRNAPATLREVFDKGRSFGEREFLVHEEERITYDAFARAAIRLAHRLQEEGVRKGDRVAIIMRNLPEWAVAFYAGVLAGAIVTPLNGWWTGAELEFGLADSGTRLAIVDEERLNRISPHLDACPALERIFVARAGRLDADPRLVRLEDAIGKAAGWGGLPRQEPPEVPMAPDDEVSILYTSGTTGRPKGALGTHRNLVTNIPAAALPAMRAMLRAGLPLPDLTAAARAPQRVNLLAVPLFHATGLVSQLVNGMNGGFKVVMMPRWDVDRAAELIEREKVSAAGGVPTIAWQLVERAERGDCDLSSLTTVSFGGAPAAPELLRKIQEVFPLAQPFTGWGMTETTAAFTTISGREYLESPASTGPAVPVSEMQVRDPENGVTVLPVGSVGEIWVYGPQVVKGYWRNPQATAETFVDGWLRTGDLGRIDDQGLLYIVDRAKDMLIRGGENIYCLEVENVLYEHPDVVDAALIGVPHRTLGEEPAAAVSLRAGGQVTEGKLRARVAARLAAFKVPVKILFWPELLPRNANGKIMKADLRSAFLAELKRQEEEA